MGIILRARRLSPSQFENLAFDLLILFGLRNASWRTPGPDAGRDIEGEVIATDLSGFMTTQRWYVECKRYSQAVDWPTVTSKLSYATNHGADYLLFLTTASMSPRCKEEIARYTHNKRQPHIRYWDAPILELRVAQHPFLLLKYHLGTAASDAANLQPLIPLLTRVVQAAYGRASLLPSVESALELSAALTDLLDCRSAELLTPGRTRIHAFRPDRDAYDWCALPDFAQIKKYDAYGLRAMLAAYRFFSAEIAVTATLDQSGSALVLERRGGSGDAAAIGNALSLISLACNVSAAIKPNSVTLAVRE